LQKSRLDRYKLCTDRNYTITKLAQIHDLLVIFAQISTLPAQILPVHKLRKSQLYRFNFHRSKLYRLKMYRDPNSFGSKLAQIQTIPGQHLNDPIAQSHTTPAQDLANSILYPSTNFARSTCTIITGTKRPQIQSITANKFQRSKPY